MEANEMQLEQPMKKTQQKELFVDVRTPSEFGEVHVPDAVNIPLADIDKFANELGNMAKDRKIMLMCRSERRAGLAHEALTKRGIENICIVPGGMTRWMEEKKAVVEGKKGMSIERQVRIAAGLFVLVGVALGTLVHPGFLAISAFVGAGLIFAGLTDTCGMAIILGKMPFNRVKEAPTCSLK